MNDHNTEHHLENEEIARAAVDREDLPAGRRAHLSNCARCAERLMRFERRLGHVGRVARQAAPAPSRPFRLPERASAARWRYRSLLAMGAAAVLVLAAVIMQPSQWPLSGRRDTVAFDAAADRKLMEDVDAIIDNDLPVAYQALASFDVPDLSDDTGVGDDSGGDDPSDWIVPSLPGDLDDESLS